jgi:hypothetical protein
MSDRRRALELLTSRPEAVVLAHGFSIDRMVESD